MKNSIQWGIRYSDTDEPDRFGRWARIMYLNSVPFAWVNRLDSIIGQAAEPVVRFSATLYFPTLMNDSARDHKLCLTFEEAKDLCETEFEKFVKLIKQL